MDAREIQLFSFYLLVEFVIWCETLTCGCALNFDSEKLIIHKLQRTRKFAFRSNQCTLDIPQVAILINIVGGQIHIHHTNYGSLISSGTVLIFVPVPSHIHQLRILIENQSKP